MSKPSKPCFNDIVYLCTFSYSSILSILHKLVSVNPFDAIRHDLMRNAECGIIAFALRTSRTPQAYIAFPKGNISHPRAYRARRRRAFTSLPFVEREKGRLDRDTPKNLQFFGDPNAVYKWWVLHPFRAKRGKKGGLIFGEDKNGGFYKIPHSASLHFAQSSPLCTFASLTKGCKISERTFFFSAPTNQLLT